MSIPSLSNFFAAIMIILGMYMNAKLFWMVVYEWRYGKGEEYLRGDFKNANKR